MSKEKSISENVPDPGALDLPGDIELPEPNLTADDTGPIRVHISYNPLTLRWELVITCALERFSAYCSSLEDAAHALLDWTKGVIIV